MEFVTLLPNHAPLSLSILGLLINSSEKQNRKLTLLQQHRIPQPSQNHPFLVYKNINYPALIIATHTPKIHGSSHIPCCPHSMPQSFPPAWDLQQRTGLKRRTVRPQTRSSNPQLLTVPSLNIFARLINPSWVNPAGASVSTSKSATRLLPR
jgi:hypothetical protein